MELRIAATSPGGGFFRGIVIGYALKNMAKLIASWTGIHTISSNSRLELEQTSEFNTCCNASKNGIHGVVTQHGFDSWGYHLIAYSLNNDVVNFFIIIFTKLL